MTDLDDFEHLDTACSPGPYKTRKTGKTRAAVKRRFVAGDATKAGQKGASTRNMLRRCISLPKISLQDKP